MEEKIVFEQVVSRGCGIDVHKKVLVATIVEPEHENLILLALTTKT